MRILLRLVALLVVFFSVLSVIRRLLAAFAPASPTPQVPTAAGHLVKDQVCGTYVPQETAIAGGNEFFCSEECRRKFIS